MTFYLTNFGTFSAVGEREAMNCLELSRALWNSQVETWLLFNIHRWSLFYSLHVWLTARKWGALLPTFKFGGLEPPLPLCSAAYVICISLDEMIQEISWSLTCTLMHSAIWFSSFHTNPVFEYAYCTKQTKELVKLMSTLAYTAASHSNYQWDEVKEDEGKIDIKRRRREKKKEGGREGEQWNR